MFPAGPLRAPLAPQLERTSALIVVGEGDGAAPIAAEVAVRGKPVLRARLLPDPESLEALKGRRCLAFAGIGDPARFFATLRHHGIDVAAEAAFADHHPFTRAEIDALVARAARERLTLVTTQKDLVRLKSDGTLAARAEAVMPFAVTLSFDGEDELWKLVAPVLRDAAARSPERAPA